MSDPNIAGSYLGIYQGTVADNNDPSRSGRVRCNIPQVLGMQVSGWCQPIYPTPSNYRQRVGDIVWIQFVNGDLSKPVYYSSEAVTADKIEAGAINGKTITGALYQTLAEPERGIKITGPDNQLLAYDQDGNNTFLLDGNTGDVTIVGSFGTNILRDPLTGKYNPGIFMYTSENPYGFQNDQLVFSPGDVSTASHAVAKFPQIYTEIFGAGAMDLYMSGGRFAGNSQYEGFAHVSSGDVAQEAIAEMGILDHLGNEYSHLRTNKTFMDIFHPSSVVVGDDVEITNNLTVDHNVEINHTLNVTGSGLSPSSVAIDIDHGTLRLEDPPTTTAAANCYIGDAGNLNKSTSSRRYKRDISEINDNEIDGFYDLLPKSFISISEDKRYYGFIAEEAADLGLDEFVVYDKQGRPDGFGYAHWTAALQAIVRKQRDQIAELTRRIEDLEKG